MTDETRPSQSTGETQTPIPDAEARRAARRASQQRRRRNSVFQYIAILFMAAFVLLLYTFMMERRQSQQQIDDLKQSASTVQTLQGLMSSNDQLKAQVSELETQLRDLQGQLTAAKEEQGLLQTQIQDEEKTTAAMLWFWELNDAYVRGRLNQCRELIDGLEEAKLQDYLPKENITGTDRFSPYYRYMEIRGKVIK